MYPYPRKTSQKRGAASEIRTPDLRITSALGPWGESRIGSDPSSTQTPLVSPRCTPSHRECSQNVRTFLNLSPSLDPGVLNNRPPGAYICNPVENVSDIYFVLSRKAFARTVVRVKEKRDEKLWKEPNEDIGETGPTSQPN